MARPVSKVPCRYFGTSSGCRFGRDCNFSHDPSSASEIRSPLRSSQQNTRPPHTPATSRTRSKRGGNAIPKGFCHFYWDSGSCNRGFDCTFKHQKNADPRFGSTNPAGGVKDEECAANVALDFFTTDNLTQMAGVGLLKVQEGTPENAHNSVKQFLGGGSLINPFDMKPLASILASVNRRNHSWTVYKAQEFLDLIVRSDQLLSRIGDILKFPDVSPRAGTGYTLLSFQLHYFPVLEYFTSDLVLKSTLHHNINALYAVMYEHWASVSATIESSVGSMISNRTWKDPTARLSENFQGKLTGAVVFKAIPDLVIQISNRFKTAFERYPQLNEFVEHLTQWFDVWATGVQSKPPTFQDPVTSNRETCQLVVQTLGETIERLRTIIVREHYITQSKRVVSKKVDLSGAKNQFLLMQLEQTYDPPGKLRPEGPRHDNDFANIADVRICPTSEELACQTPPYLPVTIPGAPHHLPASSMERHLDIQFRLLREELTYPIRESLKVLREDLNEMWSQSHGTKREQTELDKVLAKGGGLYKSSGKNSVIFTVYTEVQYSGMGTGPRGFSIELRIRPPPGTARDPESKKRVDYWKYAGNKRLTSGSLVALVLVSSSSSKAYLANLVSSVDDIAESAKHSADYIQIKAKFFDPEVEIGALKKEKITIDAKTFGLLIDNGVMFESLRPFLKTLNAIDSTSIPFSKYICAQDSLENVRVRPPRYATAPGFRFELESMENTDRIIDPLNVNDPESVARARAQLGQFSTLDPSQADSVIDSLTKEVSLIQGPPGTGKSYVGKELLRILFNNKIKPIVLIAFTNHALDHMLNSILDAKITENIVRLGSRSTDERIGKYSLWNLEKDFEDNSTGGQLKRGYAIKKQTEEEMYQVIDDIQIPEPTEDEIKGYLKANWEKHLTMMYDPPLWIVERASRTWRLEGKSEVKWKVLGKMGKAKEESHLMGRTYYGFWKRGLDIAFIRQPLPHCAEVPDWDELKEWGLQDAEPDMKVIQSAPVPTGNRRLVQLQDSPAVWAMSLKERQRLAGYWEGEMRRLGYDNRFDEYQEIRELYEDACERYEEASDEKRRHLLGNIDLIGCTTTGAAKLTSLLTSIRPRVLVVEEGGQVLEAHILASLVGSVQHLICIGDPKQLRPNLATYSLSTDSGHGKNPFRFDRSLMERLADNGFPMSQINVQRRMRPEISHHIRTILYPKLEDNEVVKNYPNVKGMSQNVVFFTHNHKEDGDQESVSKVNSFEVNMIVDLVMYLLRQGEYGSQGDIAILCAYLGQLQKLRAALKSLKITVAVDERDEDQLVKQGLQDEVEKPSVEEVAVVSHVRLGTVDIFQGQEAKVVIVSLVRNSGEFNTDNASIGFLKSENRINVALSRAKHGLYVMGNASNLRKSPTWCTIIEEMEKQGQIGFGFPIVCTRHPDQTKIITKPGQLPKIAPLGGCLSPCGLRLSCGHSCQSLCHADLNSHNSTFCYEKCALSACIRQHPCVKLCHQPCGDCKFSIPSVTLPCGHIEEKVPCHNLDDLMSVKCQKVVKKKLKHCVHSKEVACHQDPASVTCTEPCGQLMGCCSKKCKGRCGDCQKRNQNDNKVRPRQIRRVNHTEHPCDRALYCQHICGRPCHPKNQGCNTECKEPCRQRCIHHTCPNLCSITCAPCLEACPWKCDHHECPVACGSICARLPCDKPCTNTLGCGHPCPSVCGEPCAMQTCVVCICMDKDGKTTIVDHITQRPISEIDTASDDVSEKLITLECRHTFTVETLDEHCGMSEYYGIDPMTGRYLSMKTPPVQYQAPPVCPVCRGPITSPRYGRITKRANLDVLEQNFANHMSKRLGSYGPAIRAINIGLEASETVAKAIVRWGGFASEEDFVQICEKRKVSFGKPEEPLPVEMLKGLKLVHGFSTSEAEQWVRITKEINRVYEAIAGIASLRSAHVKAYEATVTTLFKLEMEAIARDPLKTNEKTQREAAFAATNAKIGQPPHKADRKYHIEAFILTIELRLVLALIASSRISELPLSKGSDHLRHRQVWTTFVGFLYDSCIKDCAKAVALARSFSASRQEARVSMVNLRCTLEKDRFDALEHCRKIQISIESDAREHLGEAVSQQEAEARQALLQTKAKYFKNRPLNSREQMKEENAWFRENCVVTAERVFVAYEGLREQVLDKGAFYQPMSSGEKRDMVNSTKVFGPSGRFVNCGHGHIFVITECGGSVQASTCPECGMTIGGSAYALHIPNTLETDYH